MVEDVVCAKFGTDFSYDDLISVTVLVIEDVGAVQDEERPSAHGDRRQAQQLKDEACEVSRSAGDRSCSTFLARQTPDAELWKPASPATVKRSPTFDPDVMGCWSYWF